MLYYIYYNNYDVIYFVCFILCLMKDVLMEYRIVEVIIVCFEGLFVMFNNYWYVS